MSGGEISENVSVNAGAGVYVNNNGVLEVSGKPIISGNKNGDEINNVRGLISVTGQLETGASIGVNTYYAPTSEDYQTITNGYGTYNNGEAPSQFFTSDMDGAVVALSPENEACLAVEQTVTVTTDGNGTASANLWLMKILTWSLTRFLQEMSLLTPGVIRQRERLPALT